MNSLWLCRSIRGSGYGGSHIDVWNDAPPRASRGPITFVKPSSVMFKSSAFICCNSIVRTTSNCPPSTFSFKLRSWRLPPSIRAQLRSEWLLQAGHSLPRLLLTAAQSRQKTVLDSGRTSGSCVFRVPPSIDTTLRLWMRWQPMGED